MQLQNIDHRSVDKDLKILSPDELYNGCLARVSINFYHTIIKKVVTVVYLVNY